MAKLSPARIENSGPIHAAGVRAHYACGDNSDIPAQWQKLGQRMSDLPKNLPAQRYAVFPHDGPVTTLSQTCMAIFRDWAPQGNARKEPDGTQIFIEHYGPGFDYRTGHGDIEVWVPVKE